MAETGCGANVSSLMKKLQRLKDAVGLEPKDKDDVLEDFWGWFNVNSDLMVKN